MSVIHVSANGFSYVYAVPTNGRGHPEDEQPFPFIFCPRTGLEHSPRFGGDTSMQNTGYASISMPFAVWARAIPTRVILTRLVRRKANIYWRNLYRFSGFRNKKSLFLSELSFQKTPNGFTGKNPYIVFERSITRTSDGIIVTDTFSFLKDCHFSEFAPVHVALFGKQTSPNTVRSENCTFQFSVPVCRLGNQESSTGSCFRYGEILKDISFSKGSCLNRITSFRYQKNSEL